MSNSDKDPHGNVPDRSAAALLIIDVINDFDFPEADELLRFARPMAERIAALKDRAKAAGIPVLYVNDNFGRWRSDFKAQVEHCLKSAAKGRDVVKLLKPEDDDYFVLKPKHSGFYASSLDVLLGFLGSRTLILTGVAGNICVLFTANDAYMRDYKLIVPRDCIASNTEAENEAVIDVIRQVLKADVRPAAQISLDRFAGEDESLSDKPSY
jgi:nicotinamidase-related amidase